MVIDFPGENRVPELKALWQEAFGEEAFWDGFFQRAFSSDFCRCVILSNALAAALCWFDCEWEGRKIAYLYAVATRPDFRGRGLCRALLEDVHALLRERGYAGTMLVPENDALRNMYAKMGYETCTTVREFMCEAGARTADLRPVDREEYAALRRSLLPDSGVLQEGRNLELLETMAEFRAGEGALLAAAREGDTLWVHELLGDGQAAPAIVKAMGCTRGRFRTPGREKAFAMFHSLRENREMPGYFGLAFD